MLSVPVVATEVDRLGWVPEAKDYAMVYLLDLHHLRAEPAYDRDLSAQTRPFDRVAYFLELQRPGDMLFYVWVSMDAFADDPRRLGVPTAWTFQRRVTHLRVDSNAAAVASGEVAEGNLEFWPNNYIPGNHAGVPGAADDAYDWGDTLVGAAAGYGSMQVHNFAARQTIFALNNWHGGEVADIGIGNAPGKNSDWTFARNAQAYQVRRLRVLVHPKP